jgi:rod shape determining protein RodA
MNIRWGAVTVKLARVNWLLSLVTLALTTMGIAFIYSAGYSGDPGSVRTLLYSRQIQWALAGVAGAVFLAGIDYRVWMPYSFLLYGGALFLLALTLVFGVEINAGRRWIRVIGEFGVQPAEFAKILVIFHLACWLGVPGEDRRSWKAALVAVALVALPTLLIAAQPDMGTALVFPFVAGVMLFVSGMRWKVLLTMVGIATLGGAVLLAGLLAPERMGVAGPPVSRVLKVAGVRDYHRRRIVGFLQAEDDPLGAGWNKRQSRIAIGSGGRWGKGYLKGTQNLLGYLPRTVAPTDFIFSVIAEETGFAGSVATLALFGLWMTVTIGTGLATDDRRAKLLCVGLAALMFCHVFVNVAMTVGLIPITGLPLPFLSYGGSFMIANLAATGLIQSVHMRLRKENVFEVV